MTDDTCHDGDPGGFVAHEAVQENYESLRGRATGEGVVYLGTRFVGETDGVLGDFFGDDHGGLGGCHDEEHLREYLLMLLLLQHMTLLTVVRT